MPLTVAWGVVLAGLPWAAFVFQPRLDIWHSQSAWMEAGLVGGLGLLLIRGWRRLPFNLPLAAFLVWALGRAWTQWYAILKQGVKTYPAELLLGWLPLLGIVIFYLAAVTMWTPARLEALVRAVTVSGIVVMAYSVTQLVGLDQFYQELAVPGHNTQLVGTIGNPSHYGVYLALLLPGLLFLTGRLRMLGLGLWGVLMSVLVLHHKSLTGLAAAGVVALWWAWHQPKRGWWLLGIVGLGSLLAVGVGLSRDGLLLSDSGRWAAWEGFWSLAHLKFITGLGAGAVRGLSPQYTGALAHWRHVHNEFFQVLIEYGVIGALLLAWVVWGWWKTLCSLKRTRLVVTLGGMGLAALVCALTQFSWHLWLTGSLALIAYCGVYALSTETI